MNLCVEFFIFIKISCRFFQAVFEAVMGSDYTGDIGLDDVLIIDGACGSPGDCNFEKGKCMWKNIGGDDFDWISGSGRTTSAYTGPVSDHTTSGPTGESVLRFCLII